MHELLEQRRLTSDVNGEQRRADFNEAHRCLTAVCPFDGLVKRAIGYRMHESCLNTGTHKAYTSQRERATFAVPQRAKRGATRKFKQLAQPCRSTCLANATVPARLQRQARNSRTLDYGPDGRRVCADIVQRATTCMSK